MASLAQPHPDAATTIKRTVLLKLNQPISNYIPGRLDPTVHIQRAQALPPCRDGHQI